MLVERTLTRRVALTALLAAMPLAMPAAGDTTPEEITTDTPAYCQHLFDRVRELVGTVPQPPPETVSTLSNEGHRLCDEGLTRPGILRLRRALMIIEQDQPSP